MAEPMDAQPTLLEVEDTPGAWTPIVEVYDITGPTMTREALDATDHNRDGWTKMVPGVKSGGTITYDIGYKPDDPLHNKSTGLLKAFDDGVTRNYRIRYPDDSTWVCPGWIQGFSPGNAIRGLVRASVTQQVTGAPTWSI